MIRELQTEVTDLKISHMSILSSEKHISLLLLILLSADSISTSKSEKFSDSFMFNDMRKELWLFIIKLYLKLERNVNWFSTDTDKISYKISYLEEDAAIIINLFYWNRFLLSLNILIYFLKLIYNNISWIYITLTKLKFCCQKNCEFTSFYSEFLALMNELNWNEDAKIVAL